jgi:hypothetical protein
MMNSKDLLHKRLLSINDADEVEEPIENQYEHYRHFTVDSQDGIAHTLRYGDVTWAEFESPSIDISLKELTKLLNAVHTKGFELHETFTENRMQVQQKMQTATTQPKVDARHDVSHSINGGSDMTIGISGEIYRNLQNNSESGNISIPRRPYLMGRFSHPPVISPLIDE